MNIKTIRLGNALDWDHSINVSNKNLNNLDKIICFSEYIRSVFTSKKVLKLGLFYSHCRIFDKGNLVYIEIFLYDWWYNDIIVLRKRKGYRNFKEKNVVNITKNKNNFRYIFGNITWMDIYYNYRRDTGIKQRRKLLDSMVVNNLGGLYNGIRQDCYYLGYTNDYNRRFDKDRYIFDYNLEWFYLYKKYNKVGNYIYKSHYNIGKDIKSLQMFRLSIIEKLLVFSGFKFFNKKVNFNYCMLNEKTLTSDLLSRYICFRLKQGYTLGEALNVAVKTLDKWKDNNIGYIGYRIECSGRFGRKQRTSFKSLSVGSLCRSKVDSYVDFGMNNVILKFGCCNIKVWLHKMYNGQEYRYKIKI